MQLRQKKIVINKYGNECTRSSVNKKNKKSRFIEKKLQIMTHEKIRIESCVKAAQDSPLIGSKSSKLHSLLIDFR